MRTILTAMAISFVAIVVIHLQLIVTWFYLGLTIMFFFSENPGSLFLAWSLVGLGALYFLWCWFVLVLNYDKDGPGPLWWRWEW